MSTALAALCSDFIILPLIFVFIFFVIKHRSKEIKAYFTPQTIKRNATIESRVFGFPTLIIPFEDLKVTVQTSSKTKNSPPHTDVSCQLPLNRDYGMSINPEHSLAKLGKIFGMKDLQSGNEEFDKIFIIQSNDEMITRNLLSHDLQAQLLSFKDFYTTVTVNKHSVQVSINQYRPPEHILDTLIETAFLLINRVLETGMRRV